MKEVMSEFRNGQSLTQSLSKGRHIAGGNSSDTLFFCTETFLSGNNFFLVLGWE